MNAATRARVAWAESFRTPYTLSSHLVSPVPQEGDAKEITNVGSQFAALYSTLQLCSTCTFLSPPTLLFETGPEGPELED
jgi:hypothetical protein